ncbi:MAG: type II secretion system protein [Deltaproteobacteria bacterium]|nr:type II secretion system protein [Deltaproteobacteria bacterium]
MADFRTNKRGFTLIEIIVVLLLICVVGAAIVMSSVYSPSEYELTSEMEVTKSRLRYAQVRAMNTNLIWGIDLFVGVKTSYYQLFKYDPASDTKTNMGLPGNDPNNSGPVYFSDGIKINEDMTVSFDTWGKPYVDAKAQTLQNEVGGWRTISLLQSGNTVDIRIRNNTGFIP